MKKTINAFVMIGVIMLATNIVYAQKPPTSVKTDLNRACKQAAIEKKKVLVIFSSSWNPWSAVLISAIKQPSFVRILNQHYILRFYSAKENETKRYLEAPDADEVFSNYFTVNDSLPKAPRKIPCTFILDSKGRKLGQYIGFPPGEAGISDFGKLLFKTSSINIGDFAIINQILITAYKKVSSPSANEILQQSFQQAATENKKVFVIFHASWCHWCHVLDTAMNDPTCKEIFTKNYVICHLVVHENDERLFEENYGGDQMQAKYQVGSNGIPFSMIFDSMGKPLFSYNGFPSPKNVKEYQDFEKKLVQSSPINEQELKIIKEAFAVVSRRNGY